MEKIKIDFDPAFARKYDRHIRVGKLMCAIPLFRALVLKLQSIFTSMKKDYENEREDIAFRQAPSSIESMQAQADGDPFLDVHSTIAYASQIHSPDFATPKHRYESYRLYEEQFATIEPMLAGDTPIKGILNFGVCYGYVDAVLAKKFPDVSFTGIDLSRYNKAINEIDFDGVPNLEFLAGDIFELMKNRDLTGWALFHSRILCKFPIEFVEKLYAAARDCGVTHIIGFEQFGYPRDHRGSIEFSEQERPSIYWRNGLLIHNYPNIVKKVGFETSSARVFTTNHASPDYRVLSFVAERRPG